MSDVNASGADGGMHTHGCPPAGATLFDNADTIPGETVVAANGAAYELKNIPGLNGACPVRISITLDAKALVAAPFRGWLFAYVAPAGLNNGTRDFVAAAIGDLYALGTLVYATYVMQDGTGWPGGGANFINVYPGGVASSIYFWSPVLPPTFGEDTYTFKNVHLTVKTA